MNSLVKILIDQDGEHVDNPLWHLGVELCGDPAVLCTGEYFTNECSMYDGAEGVTYLTKTVKRGGVECDKCLDLIKYLKGVKL